MFKSLFSSMLIVAALGIPAWAQETWRDQLFEELPLLGHRNWIAVVDSAYPLQTSPGIKMVYVGGEQVRVVRQVLDALDRTDHVAPVIYTDAELKHVPERLAPGVGAYRADLATVLQDRKVQSLPHEEIIAKLDEAGKTFRVLVLKTKLTVPYTSVFMELDCGYWGPEAEQELRALMKGD
ncbi:MAG: hypothetical protein KJ000_27215 [Pirellulaceae bacterium]|nr:hypothetical protein [Pirellulaceae bacterium]